MAAAIPIAGAAMSVAGGIMNKDEQEVMHTQQMPTMTGEQIGLIQKLAGHLSGQIGKGVTPYDFNVVQGPDLLQELIYGRAKGTSMDQMGMLDQIIGRTPEQDRDYWEKMYKAPALEMFEQDIVPGLLEKYTAMDATDSGAARRALAHAGASMNTDLNAKLADLLFQSENRKPQLMGQQMNLMNQLAGIGEASRQMGMEQGQERYNKWAMTQAYNNPWLQQLSNPLLSATPFENAMYSQMEGGSKTGKMLGGIGGALSGGGGK